MFNGKKKALTFSYDDNVTQDIRLIEIFNKYNLKATFNINSEKIGERNTLLINGKQISHNKNKKDDIKYIYDGHEIAVHTLTHPNLTGISDEKEIIRQVEQDRINLSEIAGYEVNGMAYPCAPPNCDDRVAEIIKNNTGVKYARNFYVTKDFEPCKDPYQYRGTLYHHNDWENLFEFGQRFLDLKTDTPKVFYIWGHAYEFDIFPERWEIFEEFCKMMSGKDDIFYGTNIEVIK